jgi:hypothetical protein
VRSARAKITDQITSPRKESYDGKTDRNMREASHYTTSQNKMYLEKLAAYKKTENYDGDVQKAKQREIDLMNKMLKSEELWNEKYLQQEKQKLENDKRMNELEQRKQRDIKKRQQEAIRREKEKLMNQQMEERRIRKEAFERIRKEREQKEIEEDKKLKQERKKQELIREKEMSRKAKLERLERQRVEEARMQEEKMRALLKKEKEREEALRQSQETERKRSLERKNKMEAFRDKVQHNTQLEEQRILEDYWTKQNEQEKKESKLRQERMKQMNAIKKQSIESNDKIRRIIEEAKRKEDEKKKILIEKDKESEQRLEMIRTKKMEEERKKKEMALVKEELKKINLDRKRRKDEYKVEKLREKYEFDAVRRMASVTELEEYKALKIKNQVEAQRKRQLVRTALHSMSIWKVWDMEIIREILNNPKCTEEATVEELVRRRVAQGPRKKNNASVIVKSGKYTERQEKGKLTAHDEDVGITYYMKNTKSDAREEEVVNEEEVGKGADQKDEYKKDSLGLAMADDYINYNDEEDNEGAETIKDDTNDNQQGDKPQRGEAREEQPKQEEAKVEDKPKEVEQVEAAKKEEVQIEPSKEEKLEKEDKAVEGAEGKEMAKEEELSEDEGEIKGLGIAAVDDFLNEQ